MRMQRSSTEHLLHLDLFDALKLTNNEKNIKFNNPKLQGEWRVLFNIYPQTEDPMDESERYFLNLDHVHEFDNNEDSDEVNTNYEATDWTLYNIFFCKSLNYYYCKTCFSR